MNNLFNNNRVTSGSIYINFIKDKLSIALTPLQKKIVLVAIAILSCCMLICFFRRCFQAKKLDLEESELQLDRDPIINQQAGKPEDVADKEAHGKSVAERLKKNQKYAAEQQAKQPAKGFIVEDGNIPSTIEIFVPKQGEIDRPIDGKSEAINGKQVGIASCQGVRPTMEDAEIAAHESFKIQNKNYSFDIFGIFDGHGGAMASAFVKRNITQYLKTALESNNQETLTEEGIFKAFKACFQKLDADYTGDDGTTATVAIILNGQIWVANVGDSRTILVKKDGKTIQATEDAKPQIERYKKTIKKLGGFVTLIFGSYRVNGNLAVARAIGDKLQKGKDGQCCISPNPKITCFSLEDFQGGHLVVACDGLYDVATTDEVGEAITQMAEKNESVENMSKKLVYYAIDQDSKDNVSVMVIKL